MLDRLSWWMRDYGGAILVLVGAAAFVIAVGRFAVRPYSERPTFEQARIVRFGSYASKFGSRPVVLVKTRDGTIRQLRVDERKTRRCKVGDTIHLVRRGSALFVRPQGCVSLAG
jgi:hypothetical protein